MLLLSAVSISLTGSLRSVTSRSGQGYQGALEPLCRFLTSVFCSCFRCSWARVFKLV